MALFVLPQKVGGNIPCCCSLLSILLSSHNISSSNVSPLLRIYRSIIRRDCNASYKKIMGRGGRPKNWHTRSTVCTVINISTVIRVGVSDAGRGTVGTIILCRGDASSSSTTSSRLKTCEAHEICRICR